MPLRLKHSFIDTSNTAKHSSRLYSDASSRLYYSSAASDTGRDQCDSNCSLPNVENTVKFDWRAWFASVYNAHPSSPPSDDADILAVLQRRERRKRPQPPKIPPSFQRRGCDGGDASGGFGKQRSLARSQRTPTGPQPSRMNVRRAAQAMRVFLPSAIFLIYLNHLQALDEDSSQLAGALFSPLRGGLARTKDHPLGVPSVLETNLADLTDPPDDSGVDVPFFWHVPKSGGTTAKEYYGRCLGLVEASESGVSGGHGGDRSIQVFEMHDGEEMQSYVNVDTTTVEGLHRAKRMGVIASGLLDVVFSPLLVDTAGLFSMTGRRGRMFALFRHPIDRAISMYQYLQFATWEPTYNEKLKEMSLEQYALSEHVEQDWMVRSVTGRPYEMGDPTKEDLVIAKKILRQKCLVGLTDHMEKSITRFNSYFGWGVHGSTERVKNCGRRMLDKNGGVNRNKYLGVKRSELLDEARGKAGELLMERNQLDIELYMYAKELFEKQAYLVQIFEEQTNMVIKMHDVI